MKTAPVSSTQPAKPADPVEAALTATNELAMVLNEEIAILKKTDVEAMRTLLRRKNKILLAYQASVKAIQTDPGLIAKASGDLRGRLKESQGRLAGIAKHNMTALRGAAAATQRLIEYIIKTVQDEALPKQGYNNSRAGHVTGAYSPTCPPLAVRRTA